MRKTIFFLFLATLLSCNNSETEKLITAERFLDEKPDSSLVVLRSLDSHSLKTPEKKARYALLMSKALDKNYIDVQSDSLIIKAVDYYSQHRNARYRMMANYYHGLILYNGGHYSTAIVAFENAERETRCYYRTIITLD